MLLDCTLRDGGYYTNWEYPNELLDDLSGLPVFYLLVQPHSWSSHRKLQRPPITAAMR